MSTKTDGDRVAGGERGGAISSMSTPSAQTTTAQPGENRRGQTTHNPPSTFRNIPYPGSSVGGVGIGLAGRSIATNSHTRTRARPDPDSTRARTPTSAGTNSTFDTVDTSVPDFLLHERDRYRDHDRDDDIDREDGKMGKKRKVPSSVQAEGRHANSTCSEADHDCDDRRHVDEGDTITDGDVGEARARARKSIPDDDASRFTRKNGRWTISDPYRSPAAKSCSWRKALFLRRKAALITLFLDAQTAINNALTKGSAKPKVILPEVAVFEQMMPALEDVGVGQWPLDQPGWRTGVEMTDETRVHVERWRTTYERRRRVGEGRKRLVRGGWVPEGSFEFEVACLSSETARIKARDQAALRKLIFELRSITLSATKLASAQSATALAQSQLQSQTVPQTNPPDVKGVRTNEPREGDESMSKTNSSQGSETTATGKKKPKKKKRSVLANQSNPHHVDNYRPGRTLGTHGDPLEPFPWHENLLFPPSMMFLSTRPAHRPPKPKPAEGEAPAETPTPVRPAEDDYMCNFCEYELYYGTESERKRAIRARRRELKRKQTIKNRAKNVAEGKGKGNLGREEEEWDEEDCEGGEGGCYGRCSCGRPLSAPDGEEEKEPPDREDHHDHHHHDHHHDHDHPLGRHTCGLDDEAELTATIEAID